jgi:hypothetical protein
MRTPASCGVCGVMGHTRRTCRIARLRRMGDWNDHPVPTQEEEERVKAELRQEFENSSTGIRWARYQRELAEHRERAAQRHQERMREINAAREAEAVRQRGEQRDILSRGLPVPSFDASHSFSQIISWARRAEREARTQMRGTSQNPKSLSLKMVSDFQENYTVDTECSICYDRMPNIGLPCKHTFCGECTVKFAKKSQTCPLCRCSFQEAHICRNIEPEEFNKISAKLYL